jgi:hypothetical protein
MARYIYVKVSETHAILTRHHADDSIPLVPGLSIDNSLHPTALDHCKVFTLLQYSANISTDNVGLNPHLISASTIENVVAAFPRKEWSSCFAAAMKEEMKCKPWCHTTVNEGFVDAVLENGLMAPYDG